MKKAASVLLAAIVLLGACSRGAPAPTEPAAPPSPGAISVNASANRPWYADRFEALGFYVFDSPAEIPSFYVTPRSGGEAIGPESFRGSVTLLNFWATWCPPCRQEMPSLQALHESLSGEDFTIAAVSVREKPATVESFLKQNPYTFPIYLDPTGEASASFASRGIPTTFVLDKGGRAIAAIIGSRPYDEPEVIELFQELARR